MGWEHFEVKKAGICKALKRENDEIIEFNYKRGLIKTGKSRVFWGYQIILKNEQMEIIGRSKGYSETYSLALEECIKKLEAMGFQLLVAGNSKNYLESAMSGGDGFGYSNKKDSVDIMSYKH